MLLWSLVMFEILGPPNGIRSLGTPHDTRQPNKNKGIFFK